MAVACAGVEWMPVYTGMTEADREKRAEKYGGVLSSLYFANKEAQKYISPRNYKKTCQAGTGGTMFGVLNSLIITNSGNKLNEQTGSTDF